MTKINWKKVKRYEPDPGAIVDVDSEPSRPRRTQDEQRKREAELADQRSHREEQSKLRDVEIEFARKSVQWLIMLSDARKRKMIGRPLKADHQAILKKVGELEE